MKAQIRNAKQKALNGIALSKEELINLLSIPLGSDEDNELRQAARDVAALLTNNTACIWTAIGTDFEPCPMNCDFCSMGEKWGLASDGKTYSEDEILERAKAYIAHGTDFIVLRTTEYFSKEKLGALATEIRRTIDGDYDIILNTGELDVTEANILAKQHVDGIYHALRLREGIDTPFDPAVRIATMKSVGKSDLNLISLVEPIGCEHSNEELADRFLNAVESGAYISGAMARVPVEGTPLGNTEILDSSRLAQIIAVLRLSGGSAVKNICVHPASLEAVSSGANVVVVETGAIPRDNTVVADEWHGFGINDAKEMFINAGYKLNNVKENAK